MNCKWKSRRRFFLLMRSRTPPISSEFRRGLNTPNPPPGSPLRVCVNGAVPVRVTVCRVLKVAYNDGLRSTQPLKVSTRDFSWGKGGRCVWLTTYHPCSAETSRKSGALIYPEPPWATSACCGRPLSLLYITTVQLLKLR